MKKKKKHSKRGNTNNSRESKFTEGAAVNRASWPPSIVRDQRLTGHEREPCSHLGPGPSLAPAPGIRADAGLLKK